MQDVDCSGAPLEVVVPHACESTMADKEDTSDSETSPGAEGAKEAEQMEEPHAIEKLKQSLQVIILGNEALEVTLSWIKRVLEML